MNKWIEYSVQYANQRSYLDDLYRVYPTQPSGLRDIDSDLWGIVEEAFRTENKELLIRTLLQLDLFPIKDSYVAYLKRDPSAISRNHQTVNRLWGRLCELGLDKIWEACSQPKETNRQIGPMFKDWVKRGCLGVKPLPFEAFIASKENAILDASDAFMGEFAREELGYNRDKGLDFLARFNGKYVIGEAKFLTDHGGHQNAQFEDAISTFTLKGSDVVSIGILDGVVYIPGRNKLYRSVTEKYRDCNIMSALVLREFLYQI